MVTKRSRGRKKTAKAAFSLVEVLFSIFILTFVMAGVYRTLNMAMRMRVTAHRSYLSVIIANNRIERAKNVGFTELPLLAEDRVRVDEQGIIDPNGIFWRTTEVRIEHGGNPNLTEMTVSVAPVATRGAARRSPESVSTLLARNIDQ